eukprot:scaffold35_cov116-Isochrysis_galbana.AAC.2
MELLDSIHRHAVGLAARRFALLSPSKKLVSNLASCLEGARAPGVSKVATTGRWSEAAEPVNSVGSSLTVLHCHGELYSCEYSYSCEKSRAPKNCRGPGCTTTRQHAVEFSGSALSNQVDVQDNRPVVGHVRLARGGGEGGVPADAHGLVAACRHAQQQPIDPEERVGSPAGGRGQAQPRRLNRQASHRHAALHWSQPEAVLKAAREELAQHQAMRCRRRPAAGLVMPPHRLPTLPVQIGAVEAVQIAAQDVGQGLPRRHPTPAHPRRPANICRAAPSKRGVDRRTDECRLLLPELLCPVVQMCAADTDAPAVGQNHLGCDEPTRLQGRGAGARAGGGRRGGVSRLTPGWWWARWLNVVVCGTSRSSGVRSCWPSVSSPASGAMTRCATRSSGKRDSTALPNGTSPKKEP